MFFLFDYFLLVLFLFLSLNIGNKQPYDFSENLPKLRPKQRFTGEISVAQTDAQSMTHRQHNK